MQKNEEPCKKAPNSVATNVQLPGRAQFKARNEEQNFQNPAPVMHDVSALRGLSYAREKRLEGIQIEFFSQIQDLSESDVMTDLRNQKSKHLIQIHFPKIRRVRGDGNCLYSSIVYPLIEILYCNSGFKEIISKYQGHDIFWNNQLLLSKEANEYLVKSTLAGFQSIKDAKQSFQAFTGLLLHSFQNLRGFYEIMIVFIRTLAIQSLKQYFKQGHFTKLVLNQQNYDEIFRGLKTFEEEGDSTVIWLLCEILEIKVRLIWFESEQPMEHIEEFEPKINKANKPKSNEVIYLKYNNGHYDILYSKLFKEIQESMDGLDQSLKYKFDNYPLY